MSEVATDPRRLFTSAQRMELYVRYSGKCSRCGVELDRATFHAHHKVAHADGGRTHVDNGLAVCVTCHDLLHRDEVDRYSHFNNFQKRYGWQDDAISAFNDNSDIYYSPTRGDVKKAFIAEVSPSGGKTIFSMKLARKMINDDLIDRVVWIVPRDSIKIGFEEDARRAGEISEEKRLPGGGKHLAIDLTITSNYAGRLRNMHGVVLTYSALNRRMIEWLRLVANTYRLLFVFDEAHHGADGPDDAGNQWGRAMSDVRDLACSIVAMTGTPVRADGKTIPLLTYTPGIAVDDRGNERPVKLIEAGFRFSYTDAVRAGVARRILCINVDPIVSYTLEFEDQVEAIECRLSAVPAAHLSRVKHVATDFTSGIVDDMLRKADDELKRMRRNGDSDAACLIVCRRGGGTNNALPKVAARILRLFGEKAVTVESADGEQARTEIKSFKRDQSRWIVAKDMISEGTNLPRVRVVCALRDVGNETYYQQLVHRATRNDADDRPEDAVVLQLALPNLVKWGSMLEAASRHIWDDPPRERVVSNSEPTTTVRSTIDAMHAHLMDDKDQVIIAGRDFTDTDPFAKDLFDDLAQFGLTRSQINMVLRTQKDRGIDITGNSDAPPVKNDMSDQQKMTLLREATGTLIKRAARLGTTGTFEERCRDGWVAVKRMAGVKMALDDIARDHPDPMTAMTRLHAAAERLCRFAAEKKESP